MEQPVKKVPLHLQSSSNRILIKGGTVVNEDGSVKADVYVEDRFGLEKITTLLHESINQ
jgi:hypothetical protein